MFQQTIQYKSSNYFSLWKTRSVFVAVLVWMCLIQSQPALSASFGSIYPGLSERLLPAELVPQGNGFYVGLVDGVFVQVICFRGQVGVLDMVYDSDCQTSLSFPEFRRWISLEQALKVHSCGFGRLPQQFGMAISQDGKIYGLVDTANQISYSLNGPLSLVSQCTRVSYLAVDAPVLEQARRSPAPPEFLNQFQRLLIPGGDKPEPSLGFTGAFVEIPKVMPSKMADCCTVELLNKKREIVGGFDRLVLLLRIANKTPKGIRGMKGSLEFLDIFGDSICAVRFKIDDVMEAGAVRTDEFGFDFNKFIERHRNLLTTGMNSLTMRWKPEMIIFTDGSSVRKEISVSVPSGK